VACQWRIRHKLILGLGLVVAILALLLAGTLKGLSSYRGTMKTMVSKVGELNQANKVAQSVARLKPLLENNLPVVPGGKGGKTRDEGPFPRKQENVDEIFVQQVKQAEVDLAVYKMLLETTVKLKRDPGKGYQEIQQVQALEEHFARLKVAMKRAREQPESEPPEEEPTEAWRNSGPTGMLSDLEVRKEVGILVHNAPFLLDAINETLEKKIHTAQEDYKISLALVLSTSVLGVLLMAGLLRFFYGWVFFPIRDLQQGAGRVAQGDFEHRIDVHSGDEMEDLANAFNDMTGRLREMYRDLARQVNERSRQLVRSERLAGVGFLAAGVAHEINNPLASIAFCSEALERRLAELLAGPRAGRPLQNSDREVITKYLKMIQEEAFRCKEITQRLLEFSRGGERRREPTDLAALTEGVLEVVRHLQNCKGKELIFQPPGKVVAWVNGQEIKSVVLNLVVNALDSMDEGGKLRISLRQRDGMAELVFADTGCGMSAEILENIFEPFFTRSRTGKGTGLGLSISHRIINQHAGEIEAASAGPNQGSTFTVRLPLQPVEPPAPAGDGQVVEYPVFPARAGEIGKAVKPGRAAA
jgi:signal transduction histidine kinase